MDIDQHILGCLLGTAMGDSIGLPREGVSRRRAIKLFGERPLKQDLIAGRGLCSDDTEHTVMVAQALVKAGADPQRFGREFARCLRWWLLRLPAGVGFGTLRACLKLWCGWSAERSGVRSAGNGPAMRSALLGIVCQSDDHLAQLVQASTRITHTDSRAEEGAHLVAKLARAIAQSDGLPLTAFDVKQVIGLTLNDEQFRRNTETMVTVIDEGESPAKAAGDIGLAEGVSGFVAHTVPAAVGCWFAHQGEFRDTVEAAVCLGGDSDTVGAIAGALAGIQAGAPGIPVDWLDGLAEWPHTVEWMESLSKCLAVSVSEESPSISPCDSSVLLLIRNLIFIPLVLTHGVRRLFPPY